MTSLRPLITIIVALVLALTTAGFGIARGQAPVTATGKMVLCAGGKAVTVWTDAQGQPVERHHLCPDAAPGFAAADALPPAVAAPLRVTRTGPRSHIEPFAGRTSESTMPPVRGPPALS